MPGIGVGAVGKEDEVGVDLEDLAAQGFEVGRVVERLARVVLLEGQERQGGIRQAECLATVPLLAFPDRSLLFESGRRAAGVLHVAARANHGREQRVPIVPPEGGG
ncbi:MAG: hypothetical protein QME60_03935 [Verrucomicrobiota bacterium]|nr:hypothetical protein [Verrucomicrobiota bacterium]